MPTSVTLILVAPWMTWLFVKTTPAGVSTIPVAAPRAPGLPKTTLMSTRPGSTLAAMAEAVSGRDEGAAWTAIADRAEPTRGRGFEADADVPKK